MERAERENSRAFDSKQSAISYQARLDHLELRKNKPVLLLEGATYTVENGPWKGYLFQFLEKSEDGYLKGVINNMVVFVAALCIGERVWC